MSLASLILLFICLFPWYIKLQFFRFFSFLRIHQQVNGHFLDVLECMISIIRYYEIVKDRIKVIKETAAAGCRTITDTDDDYERIPIMSQHMLDKRWKQTDDGLGDIPAFGNLQVIIVGDFFQLPPIADTNNHNNNNNKSDEFWVDERSLRIGRQGCYGKCKEKDIQDDISN